MKAWEKRVSVPDEKKEKKYQTVSGSSSRLKKRRREMILNIRWEEEDALDDGALERISSLREHFLNIESEK